MCPACDGLGELYSFDPALLVPDRARSFKQGCFELLGPWREMGRWRRHIYQGVADTLERKLRPGQRARCWKRPGTSSTRELQTLWLWGTGDEHITFTWRSGPIGPQVWRQLRGHHPRALLDKYRNTQSKMQLRQLEKYMRVMACERLPRRAAQPAGPRGDADHARIRASPTDRARSLPEVCALAGQRRGRVLQRLGARRDAGR